jgi:hypothetical protein
VDCRSRPAVYLFRSRNANLEFLVHGMPPNLSAAGFGQPLPVGVFGGASITQLRIFRIEQSAYPRSLHPKTMDRRCNAGVRFPAHLSAEVDGLCHERGPSRASRPGGGLLMSSAAELRIAFATRRTCPLRMACTAS